MTPRERLIMARGTLHLNQRQLAQKINVSSQLISQIENDKINLSWQTARIIQAELGVSAGWLLYGEGEMVTHEREREKLSSSPLSPSFDYYPAITDMLNRIASRMTLEEWNVLNSFCIRILKPEEQEE